MAHSKLTYLRLLGCLGVAFLLTSCATTNSHPYAGQEYSYRTASYYDYERNSYYRRHATHGHKNYSRNHHKPHTHSRPSKHSHQRPPSSDSHHHSPHHKK